METNDDDDTTVHADAGVKGASPAKRRHPAASKALQLRKEGLFAPGGYYPVSQPAILKQVDRCHIRRANTRRARTTALIDKIDANTLLATNADAYADDVDAPASAGPRGKGGRCTRYVKFARDAELRQRQEECLQWAKELHWRLKDTAALQDYVQKLPCEQYNCAVHDTSRVPVLIMHELFRQCGAPAPSFHLPAVVIRKYGVVSPETAPCARHAFECMACGHTACAVHLLGRNCVKCRQPILCAVCVHEVTCTNTNCAAGNRRWRIQHLHEEMSTVDVGRGNTESLDRFEAVRNAVRKCAACANKARGSHKGANLQRDIAKFEDGTVPAEKSKYGRVFRRANRNTHIDDWFRYHPAEAGYAPQPPKPWGDPEKRAP